MLFLFYTFASCVWIDLLMNRFINSKCIFTLMTQCRSHWEGYPEENLKEKVYDWIWHCLWQLSMKPITPFNFWVLLEIKSLVSLWPVMINKISRSQHKGKFPSFQSDHFSFPLDLLDFNMSKSKKFKISMSHDYYDLIIEDNSCNTLFIALVLKLPNAVTL